MQAVPMYQRNKTVRSWVDDESLYLEAGFEDPVHHIILSLRLNESSYIIEEVDIDFLRVPYPDYCPQTGGNYRAALIGLKIGPGFNSRVKQKLPKTQGCVHVAALLREAADAAMQSGFYRTLDKQPTDRDELRRKLYNEGLQNICFAYSDAVNSEENGRNSDGR